MDVEFALLTSSGNVGLGNLWERYPRGSPYRLLFSIWARGRRWSCGYFFLIVVIRRLTATKHADIGPISRRRLLFNRLLYDRDIADREEWLYRVPDEANLTEDERACLEKKRRKKGMF